MGALGLVMLWFGYWVAYYGFDQIDGGNNSFMSLGIPGKYTNAPKDSASSSGSGSGQPGGLASAALGVGASALGPGKAAANAVGQGDKAIVNSSSNVVRNLWDTLGNLLKGL